MSTMLKQTFMLLGAGLALFGAAHAQNADEIDQVLNGHSCPSCNLFQAGLAYSDLPAIDVSGARLRQADLSLSTMNSANFEGTDLSIANLFGGRFTKANFKNADLTSAVLVGGYFGFAQFDGATLENANLSGSDFTDARGLTQDQLSVACGDEDTVLPNALTISFCQ